MVDSYMRMSSYHFSIPGDSHSPGTGSGEVKVPLNDNPPVVESGSSDSRALGACQPDLVYEHADLERVSLNLARCMALLILAGELLQFLGTRTLAHPWRQIGLGLYPTGLWVVILPIYLVPIVNHFRFKAEIERRLEESVTYWLHGFQWRKGDRIMEVPWTAVQCVRRLSSSPLSWKFNFWEVRSSEGIFTIFQPGLSEEKCMLGFSIRLRMGNGLPASPSRKVTWSDMAWMWLLPAAFVFKLPDFILTFWFAGCILFCPPLWRTDSSFKAAKSTPPNYAPISDPNRDE